MNVKLFYFILETLALTDVKELFTSVTSSSVTAHRPD